MKTKLINLSNAQKDILAEIEKGGCYAKNDSFFKSFGEECFLLPPRTVNSLIAKKVVKIGKKTNKGNVLEYSKSAFLKRVV